MLQGSILQKLEAAYRHTTRPIRFGVYYKNTLVALCHALEDHILNNEDQPIVITCFQRGKWYLQEADRYADIAMSSREIAIMATSDAGFAEHPTSQLPNVDTVALQTADPVAQEWHLIIVSPKYTSMVICQELSDEDYGIGRIPSSDLERKFYGMWTFEPDLVLKAAELAIAHIEQYKPELAQKLTDHKQAIQTKIAAPEELASVVSRVIDYLKTGDNSLSIVTGQNTLSRNLVSNEVQAFLRMAQLMDIADIHNPMAAAEVAAISETMGQLLDLPAWQIKRLRLAGLLHRIDPIQHSDDIQLTHTTTTAQEAAPSCPLVPGAQVLRTMPQLRAVAQIITHQTEWWDGTGEPAGLAGEEIPLESRILALAADFQWRVSQQKYSTTSGQDIFGQALEQCQQQQTTRFDPKLIDTLTLLVMGLQQGLDLSIMTPKVSSSMWLIDSRWDNHSKSVDEITSYSK
ncbi:MAG: HD domain-containing protein [Nostocales cyanobacterium]|nr:MAG: HD domain-containing protein [Nostocales cyanobacterium]